MKSKKLLRAITISLAFFATVTNAQTRTAGTNTQLSAGAPSVYLSYERTGTYESFCSTKPTKGYLLRLHNNSPLPINIDSYPVDIGAVRTTIIDVGAEKYQKDFLLEGSEVKACYDVEQEPITLPTRKGKSIIIDAPVKIPLPSVDPLCSCIWRDYRTPIRQGYWIPSGGSVLFGVPILALKKNMKIFTSYHYEWETSKGSVKKDEPRHQVYFHAEDVPSSLN